MRRLAAVLLISAIFSTAANAESQYTNPFASNPLAAFYLGTGVASAVGDNGLADFETSARAGFTIGYDSGHAVVWLYGRQPGCCALPMALYTNPSNGGPQIFMDTGGNTTIGKNAGLAAGTAVLEVIGPIRSDADSFVSGSDFTATSNVTLTAITGLTTGAINLVAGKTYAFDIWLYTTSTSGGGIQVDLNGGSATATTLIGDSLEWDGTTIGVRTRFTALTTVLCSIAAVATATCHITGTIVVNGAGTLIPRFAQNTTNVGASAVKVGSSMTIRQLN